MSTQWLRVQIDYPAVMGSRSRLWAKCGDAWGGADRWERSSPPPV